MKTFISPFSYEKLVRTENPNHDSEGFKARVCGLESNILLICAEDETETRIVLSKNDLRRLRRQLRKAEKELGWKE